jgi:hypothetical protein
MTSSIVKFTPATSVKVGKDPYSLIVGDFNGDGFADLASANYQDNNVSILLGNGQGKFSPATNFTVGSKPFYLTKGDFNGDGFADLATANYESGNISVLLGNGKGGFGTATNFVAGNAPISIATGDFNKDGISDLVVADNVKNLSVLLGDGKGGFGTPTKFVAGTDPIAVSVGDFNGDGFDDLAAANVGNKQQASVLLGNGKGSFGAASSVAVGAEPAFAAVGDFNGDGFADLATANYQTDNVSILLGNGKGNFGNATNFATGSKPLSISVGDFNGDGFADLATANMDGNNVSVLLGNGKGSFGTATNLAVGNSPGFVTVGDFNGDGIPDLVTANRGTNDVSVLVNQTGVPSKNNPPVVGQSIANQTIITGNALKFIVDEKTFTDPDPGDVLSYSAKLADGKTLPTWLKFDAASRTFSGTPAISDVDNLTIAVTATDKAGATVASNFGLNVQAAVITPKNSPPVVGQSIANQTITTGNALNFIVDEKTFTDPDPGDVLSYSAKLADGKTLPTWLKFDAASRTFSGTPFANDIRNLSVAVTATDKAGATVASNFSLNVNPAVITPPANPTTLIDLRSVNDQPVQATFRTQRSGSSDNHVSFYKVEDTQGAIVAKNGTKLKPGDGGYLAAAIENRLTNIDLISLDGQTITSRSTLRGGAIYAPLLNANDTLYNLNHLGNIYTPFSAANFDKVDHVKLVGENTLGFEDTSGGGDKDFNDTTVKFSLQIAPTISNGVQDLVLDTVKVDPKLPNSPTSVSIDLTSYTGQTLKADITNSGSSAYTNNIGFYVVEDAIGSIKLGDGKILKPGDANYAAEAAKNALENSLQASKSETKLDLNIAGGKIYAPIIVTKGTLKDLLAKNSTNGGGANDIHAYFNYLGANPDKVDHFRLIGNNTFGVEDMYGGGDKDFNDLVVNLNVKSNV